MLMKPAPRLAATRSCVRCTNRAISFKPMILPRELHQTTALCRAKSADDILLTMPNCMSLQYGFPCVCEECREEAERRKTICDICKVSPKLRIVSAKYGGNHFRKDMIYGTFTSLCRQCWDKYSEAEAIKERERRLEREQEIKEILQERKERVQELMREQALDVEKVDKMLEGVRRIQSTEQVPIAYALDRSMAQVESHWGFLSPSRQELHQDLRCCLYRRSLSKDLQIEKVRGRYKCNKERVDAIDFNLWYSKGR